MSDRWLVAWGAGSVALGGASLIVPLYVVQLGGTALTLGTLAAFAAFVGVPGALLVAPHAERTGRQREVVLIGLLVLAVMLGTIPLVETIPAIVVLNAVIWLVFASIIPVLTLLVVSGTPEAAWSEHIARLNAYQGIGWAIGLLAGAVVSSLVAAYMPAITGQRILLYLYASIALFGLIAGHRWLPREEIDLSTENGRRIRRALRRAARFNVRAATFPFTPSRMDVRGLDPRRFVDRFTPTLATYFLALFLCFVGFAAFFAPLPAFLNEFAFDDGEIFGLYVIISVAAAFCFRWAGRLAGTYGALPVQALGLGARGLSLPVAAFVVIVLGVGWIGLGVVGLVFVVIGVTWALIIVTAGTLVSQLSPPSIRGEALGCYGALMAFAGGVGSMLGGRLALVGYLVAFGVAGLLVGLSTLLVVYLHRVRTVTPDGVEPRPS